MSGVRLARAVLFLTWLLWPVLLVSADHLKQAVELIRRGDLDGAEKEAQQALEDPVTRPLAYATLGGIRLQQNRYEESETLLKKALELEPRLLGAQLNLASLYMLQQKPVLAASAYRGALKLDANHSGARFGLARAQAAMEQFRDSLITAQPILPELRKSPEGLLLLAENHLGLQDYASARPLVEDWMKLNGVESPLSVSFALLFSNQGLVDEAVRILEAAKQNQPLTLQVAFNLAGSYLLKGDLARASAHYQLARSFDENCIACYRQLARIASRQGDDDLALSNLLMAKRRAPDDPDVLLEYGGLCLRKNLFEEAGKALEQAVELRPEHGPTIYALASYKVGKKLYAEARALFEGLLKRHPQDPQLNYALGAVLYLDVHLDKAEEYLRKSIRLQPEQLTAYYYLGLTLERQGSDAGALEVFQDLLRRHPQHAPSHEALGTLFFKLRRFEEARAALAHAVELDPQSRKAHYQLGLALARLGRTSESEAHLQRAKELRAGKEAEDQALVLINP